MLLKADCTASVKMGGVQNAGTLVLGWSHPDQEIFPSATAGPVCKMLWEDGSLSERLPVVYK